MDLCVDPDVNIEASIWLSVSSDSDIVAFTFLAHFTLSPFSFPLPKSALVMTAFEKGGARRGCLAHLSGSLDLPINRHAIEIRQEKWQECQESKKAVEENVLINDERKGDLPSFWSWMHDCDYQTDNENSKKLTAESNSINDKVPNKGV